MTPKQWPFTPDDSRRAAQKLDDMFLAEMKHPQPASTLRERLANIIAPGADKTFIHNYMQHYIDDLELLCQEIAREARGSEQNRLFAVLRYLGVEHDAKAIMKVRKEWDATAEAHALTQKLAEGEL